MFDTIFWAVIGTLSGVIFGVIPGAGPFVATATLYPFLTHIEPVNVMMYYITVLIATNYTNSVTAILYGIPGDATAMSTARNGHRLFLKGFGNLAVASNAVSSTVGVIFAFTVFILVLPYIIEVFRFYNSVLQTVIVAAAIIMITLLTKQNKLFTIVLFLFGGMIAKIGIDPITFDSFLTFNNSYLAIGIPFASVMIGLYIVPELTKLNNFKVGVPKRINTFTVGKDTTTPTLIGSFVGFWCGLIPGVTNILGSYLSANFFKKDLNKIAASEAANNSGALSSLLPLIILGIPIVGSEVLIFYLIVTKGFIFSVDTMSYFTDILYFIPIVLIICVVLSWGCFNILGQLAQLYKKHKNTLIISIVSFICIMSINIYPVQEWLIICLLVLGLIGYALRKFDTFPILYGYFLTDLFWDNLMRVMVIY